MKRFTKLASAALVLAGALAFSSSMRAQSTLIYNDGDLFMGFNSAGSTNDYLIDLGSYSQFTNEPAGFHLSLGNFGVDLTSVFGSGWATDNTLQWGVAGTHDFDSNGNEIANLYASKAEPTVGTLALPWARHSITSQSGTSSNIETMAYGDFYGNNSTSDHSNAYVQPKNGENWGSWNNGSNSPGSSFQTWVPTIEAPVQPGTGSGIASTRLDLFQILPDQSGTNPPGTYLGTFSIDSAGDISFDVTAVPEPSTYALIAVGGAFALIVALRQRRAANSNAA